MGEQAFISFQKHFQILLPKALLDSALYRLRFMSQSLTMCCLWDDLICLFWLENELGFFFSSMQFVEIDPFDIIELHS